MKLAEAKPGDKIAKCKYCHSGVDLPDAAEKQHFDLNGFFQNMDLCKFKNVTVTSSTIVMKNGVVVDSDGTNDDVMNIVKEALRNSRMQMNVAEVEDPIPNEEEPERKKSLFKKWLRNKYCLAINSKYQNPNHNPLEFVICFFWNLKYLLFITFY